MFVIRDGKREMKITIGNLKRLIKESVENDEINTIEVGDLVDVDVEELGILKVRVTELVDDVQVATGYMKNDPTARVNMDDVFNGPGFVGDIDPDSGESGELVFSANQIVPGSKAKYYFPELGIPYENGRYSNVDGYGREEPNPYKKMARHDVTMSRERGPYTRAKNV
jgi:hypothetical protein